MGEDRHMIWEGGSWGDTPLDCRFGPAEVELDVVYIGSLETATSL